MASSALTKTLINRDPFTKKDSFVHYLFYATLVIYVHVLGTKKGETKNILSFPSSIFWSKYFFFLWYDDVYCGEGHTSVDICVKQSWKKVYLKNLMTETSQGFFKIEYFYGSCNFGCWWLIFKDIVPTCCTHQNLCMTFTSILGFL